MITASFIHGISEIRPYLYLCGYYQAVSPAQLKGLNITHAVDASNILTAQKIPDIEYYYVRVDDNDKSDIKKHFVETSEFIHAAKKAGGKIVVYCAAGISRSATLCIMYLVIQENLSLRDAYIKVRLARPGISPNLSFWRQMIEYESETKGGKPSVTFVKQHQLFIPDVYLKPAKNSRRKKFCCIN